MAEPNNQSELVRTLLEERARNAVEEAVGRVVLQSVAAESGIMLCVMAAGCDYLQVWGRSGNDLSTAVHGLHAPPALQSKLDMLVDEYYRLYKDRNQIIHGIVNRENGKSLRLRRVPKRMEDRQAFAEALSKDSLSGLEIRDADLSDIHNLANDFIMLGRSAFETVFDLQELRHLDSTGLDP